MRADVALFGMASAATDLLPPRWRYAYVHRLTAPILRRPLPILAAAPGGGADPAHAVSDGPAPESTCLLAVGPLEVGGIGTVVESLAYGLRELGIRPVVLCEAAGVRAERLRGAGIDVVVATDESSALDTIASVRPDAIELHGAPTHLEAAVLRAGIPFVPVLHNMEIHFTPERWRSFAALVEHSDSAIAVSETVRRFHDRRLGHRVGERIAVVPNGMPSSAPPTAADRRRARAALDAAIGADTSSDFVLVELARYDSQKNIAGTVASFLTALERRAELRRCRLVIAGPPSDWVEYRRAEAVRSAGVHGDRVALLGASDGATLLAAADAFLLNSFFEGWPMAATEAESIGLPMILSDSGGAGELVARSHGRSEVIPNAVGDAEAVDDRAVRIARRTALRQSNRDDLAAALERLLRAPATTGAAETRIGSNEASMAAGHARVLRAAMRPASA